jgi:hypothetical protein
VYLRKLEPFDVDGHRVRAVLNRARWLVVIDGVQTDGGLDGRFDDTEEFVRQHMIYHAGGMLMLSQRFSPGNPR